MGKTIIEKYWAGDMAWEISWAEMCRTCMDVDGDLLPLYDEDTEIKENDIAFKLSRIASVEVKKFDGLPAKICDKCAYRTSAFYDFQCLIQESDKKLRQMMGQQVYLGEKDNQFVNQTNEIYNTSEIQLDGENYFTTEKEKQDSFNNSENIHILLQTVDENSGNTTIVENLENVCNAIVLNVEENLNASSDSNGAELENLHALIHQDESTNLNVVNNINESQLIDNQNNYEIEGINILSSETIEVQNKNEQIIELNLENSLEGLDKSIENFEFFDNSNSRSPKLDDHSESKNCSNNRDNIAGSLNDTITKVKEIKENGKVIQYQCTLCVQNYKELSEILCHIVDLHVPKTGPFYCIVCEKDCDNIEQLKAHVKTHKGPCPYTCFLCHKSYIMKRYLKRHMACHTDFPRYRCTKCGERFKVKNELENHISSSHSDEASYKCDQCARVFNHRGNYKRHLICHLDPKGLHLPKYPCTVCKRRFLNNRTLITHMRVHTGEKPYKCDICHKAFSQRGNLLNHKKIHDNPRSYKCDVCGKSFNQKSTLREHSLLHSGEKPHVCKECGIAFTFSAALRRHLWSHKNIKPFECDVCNAKFVGKYDLKRHLKIHNFRPESKQNKSNDEKQSNDNSVSEEVINIVEDSLNQNTIFIEQIFLCDSIIPVVSQGDSEKENTDSLLGLIQYE